MKSRNLFLAAMAAIMVGGVVLTPAIASAQSRDRHSRDDQQQNRSYGSDSSRRSTQSSRQPVHLQGGYLGDGRRPADQRNSRDTWAHRPGSDNSAWGSRRGDGDNDRDDRNRQWDRDRNRHGDGDNDRDDRYRRTNNYGYRYSAPYYGGYGYSAPRYNTYNTYNTYGGYGYSNYGDSSDWRTIADVAGLLSVIGILEHDNTLAFVGGAGALYALDRYDQDRYSDDPACRLRAEYFSHPYFIRNGRRYDRVTVHRSGRDYYQFVCR